MKNVTANEVNVKNINSDVPASHEATKDATCEFSGSDEFNLDSLMEEIKSDLVNAGKITNTLDDLKSTAKEVVGYITTITDEYQGMKVLCNVPIVKGRQVYYQPVVEDESGDVLLMTPNTVDLTKTRVVKAIFNRALNNYSGGLDMRSAFKAAESDTKVKLDSLFEHGFFGYAVGTPEVTNIQFKAPLRAWKPGIQTFDELVDKVASSPNVSWSNIGGVSISKLTMDYDPKLDEYYNFMFNKLFPDPEQRIAVLRFFALSAFSNRSGMARPILYLLGDPGTGKSLTLELGRSIVGREACAPLSADLSAARFMMPNGAYMTLDETPVLEDNSKREFWMLLKKISKAIGYTQWDVKNMKAAKLKVGAYVAIASNNMAIASSSGDSIDNVVSIKMSRVFDVQDWVMDNGVNAAEAITGSAGLPYAFLKNTLWPIFMELTKMPSRFGMPIYVDPLFSDLRATISEETMRSSTENLQRYCVFIGSFRAHFPEHIKTADPVVGNFFAFNNNFSSGCNSAEQSRLSRYGIGALKLYDSNYSRISVSMLIKMMGAPTGQAAVRKAREIATSLGYHIPEKFEGRDNPSSSNSVRWLWVPNSMFRVIPLNEFTKYYKEELDSVFSNDTRDYDNYKNAIACDDVITIPTVMASDEVSTLSSLSTFVSSLSTKK